MNRVEKRCYFGAGAGPRLGGRCRKMGVWFSTFDGKPTMCWCEEHKPSGPPLARHGFQRIRKGNV